MKETLLLLYVLCVLQASSASTVTIGGLVYDFQQNFPDMNLGGPKCTNDRGIVQNVLPSNRIPVYNSSSSHPTVTSATTFGEWFTSTPGTNLPIAYLFNLTQAGNWFTYTPANFYIINGQGFGNNQPNTNQFFTFQMHAVFTYLGYETLNVSVNDDFFLFINYNLVIDLGGCHTPEVASINLQNLGLTPGNTYSFDLFYAQRGQNTGANFKMWTQIQLSCPLTDWCGVCLGDGQSCCKCPNYGNCTVGMCNATTGACLNSTRVCPTDPNNLCSGSQCVPGVGCVTTPLNCSDNNLCTTDTCSPSTGCVNTPQDCSVGSLCYTDTCDPNVGCINTLINCTDDNPCTLDTCNDDTGCVNILFDCDDGNACTLDTCIPFTGNISINNIIESTLLISNRSLIIPMDNLYQSSGGLFNLAAYGAAATLLHANVWLYWAIRAGKVKDDIDFTANVHQVLPHLNNTNVTLSFRAGPLIVPYQFHDQALSVLQTFDHNVNIYELVTDTYIYIKDQLLHKPFIGVLNSGGNYPIQAAYLTRAGMLQNITWTITSGQQAASLNSSSCYTACSEPHFDSSGATLPAADYPLAMIAFLKSGGNFLAECAGIISYENGNGGDTKGPTSGGWMQTTGGIVNNNMNNLNLMFSAPDWEYMQFEGGFDGTQGGSTTDFYLAEGSSFRTNVQGVITDIGITPTSYKATAGKWYIKRVGSNMHYLGGHNFNQNTLNQTNAVRMYLNAVVLTPSDRAVSCPTLDICSNIQCPKPTVTCNHTTITCDDNSKCTMDSCDPQSGCLYVRVICDDFNQCTSDSCDPAQGCVYTPIVCDDHSVCTNDSCIPITGCQFIPIPIPNTNACVLGACNPVNGTYYTNVTCAAPDACTTSQCDPTVGCIYNTINCNDNDPCTIDFCNSTTGCVHVPINCTACTGVYCANTDKCHPYVCDPLLSGTCVYTPVNCNDSNPCTTDYCYMNSLGNPLCANVPINCNDNNPCTTDRCVNGVCQHNPVVCNDGNGCTNDYCSLGVCHFVPVTCNDGNPCTTDTCDALNTTLYKCQFTPINCDDGNGCTKDLCAVNGSTNYRCEHLPITCFGSTLCNPISCHGNGTCVPSVFCVDDNLCTSDLCTVVQGKPTCNFKPILCPNNDACNPQSCNSSTGRCYTTPFSCDDHNICTNDKCSSKLGYAQCIYTSINCSDGNACTLDSCDPNVGCVHNTTDPAVFCNDNNVCTQDFCSPSTGCYHNVTVFPAPNQCKIPYCDPIQGVGYTAKTCGQPNECHCDSAKGCVCNSPPPPKSLTPVETGLSVGAVVLLVAGIIGAVACISYTSKKGYDYIKVQNAEIQNVNDNPLFTPRNKEVENPFYKGHEDT